VNITRDELNYKVQTLQNRIMVLKGIIDELQIDARSIPYKVIERIQNELAEITPPKEVVNQIGWQFYFAYKDKHPEINERTHVEKVPYHYYEHGFQWLLPVEQEIILFTEMTSPYPTTNMIPRITIRHEDFEKWAFDKYVYERVVFVAQINTLFRASQPERRTK